jgi:hypothetical protein
MHCDPARSDAPRQQLQPDLLFRIYYEPRTPNDLDPFAIPRSAQETERELTLFESGHVHWVCKNGVDSKVRRTSRHELMLTVFGCSDVRTTISALEKCLFAHSLRGQQLVWPFDSNSLNRPRDIKERTMFGLFKRKQPDDIPSQLVNQAIGGQSVMYRFFREGLECDDSSIRKIELSYLAMAVLSANRCFSGP